MAGFAWTPSTTEKVNTEVTGTFTLKDNDVSAIYIDWADGASTKKEDANYQWIEITETPVTVTATHTYNAVGTFGPVLQFINSRGFASKYMSGVDHSANVQPFQRNNNIESITISDDTPTAVMRVENTTVKAGIDNSIMEVQGPAEVRLGIAPTLTQTELNTIGQIKLEIEALVEISKYSATTSDVVKMGSQNTKLTIPLTVDLTNATNKQKNLYSILSGTTTPLSDGVSVFGKIARILSVKYVSCKSYGKATPANAGTDYTINELFNRLKIFLVAKSPVNGLFYPITYITAGMPYKSAQDRDRYISMDFSQSRAAASNISLSNYRYDNGKMWDTFFPVENWELSTNILSTPLQTGSAKEVRYSYLTPTRGINTSGAVTGKTLFTDSDTDCLWYTGTNTIQDNLIMLDDFGRIPSQYYLVRNSTLASSNSGSIITTNQPEVFYVKSTPSCASPDTATISPVTDYTTAMKNNAVGQRAILGEVNNVIPTDMFGDDIYGDTTGVNSYLLLAFDSKTNKVFFNMANWAQNIMTDVTNAPSALSIGSVEYLRIDNLSGSTQNAYWKPLMFKDTTRLESEYKDDGDEDYTTLGASFCKSGFISYDMPLDWNPASIKDLCGGVYNTAPGTLSEAIEAGTADTIITGTVTNNASVANYGKTTTIAGANTDLSALGTADEIGAYKYIGILKSGSGVSQPSGAAYWLASGTSTNGWNGTTGGGSAVTFQYGETGTVGGNSQHWVAPVNTSTVEMIVRRVNIFDVIQGASKVFQDDSTNTTLASALIMPVDSQNFRIGSVYFQNTYNADSANITGSSWATNPKYLLKINLKGSTDAYSAANAVPEIQNIFDGNQADSAIIKQIDDSGFNLNSLAVTSDISLSRSGHYFKAITRKGKVYISKTGIQLSTFGLSSVALGDESLASAFDSHGPSTLYGHLHTMRRIQAENVPVYWDEPQKDGTFVRLFGNVTDLTETRGTDGPRAVVRYSFNVTIREIALIDNVGNLMTDLFPLGGIQNERISTSD
tara:strand:+ start:6449 stop:9487 length:3039 start_codon:yes stop_codon:yes gene_type:complete